MMRRIAALIIVVATTVALLALTKGGSATAATTDLRLKESLCSDQGSHCLVSGPDDRFQAGETLAYSLRLVSRPDGTRVGREEGTCVKFRRSSERAYCDFVAHLPDGDVTMQGTINLDGSQPAFLAITGGTGTYEGASGYWRQHGQSVLLHIVTP